MRVVTNNPRVLERVPEADFVPGSPVEVLGRVEVLLGTGFRLAGPPVAGNLVMLRSPFRSVLLEESPEGEAPAEDFMRVADARGRAFDRVQGETPERLLDDYALMDSMFLDRAVEECGLTKAGPGIKKGGRKNMSKVIAILGGGNAGQTSAAELSLLGYECRLYQDPDFAHEIRTVFETGQIRLGRDPKGGCRVEGVARVSLVTTDMAAAVKGADVVLCHLPAFAHASVAEQLADCVEDGQVVVLLPGTLGTLVFVETLKRKGVRKDVLIAETNTNSYDTRVLGPGYAYAYKMNAPLQIGVFPANRSEEALKKLEGIYDFVPVADILEAAFHSHNPVIHTPACIMSVSRIERSKGDFYLYEEAFGPTVCRVTKMLDEERIAVARAFGYDPLTLEQLLSGVEHPGDLFKETNGNPGLCFIKGPESVKSRYFTEDGLNGLVPWSQLGAVAGVPTPLMEAFATIEGAVIERDMWGEGRTLEVLGLAGMNVGQIRDYLRTGEKKE